MEIFHLKVSKIPALIEVMRPSIVDEKAFETMTKLHTESIIQAYDSVYDLLEHNARVHNEFLFLLKLSVNLLQEVELRFTPIPVLRQIKKNLKI